MKTGATKTEELAIPMYKDENLTRRNRLAGFRYNNPGYYFLTACSIDRLPLFSEIQGGSIRLSPIGSHIETVIQDTFSRLSTLMMEECVIMPNHLHLLIYSNLENETETASSLMKTIKGVSMTNARKAGLLPEDMRTIWQKGFHDEIVRDECHLARVRAYIADNPRKWVEDEYF